MYRSHDAVDVREDQQKRDLAALRKEFAELRTKTKVRPGWSNRRPPDRWSLEDAVSEQQAWNFKPKGPPGTGKT